MKWKSPNDKRRLTDEQLAAAIVRLRQRQHGRGQRRRANAGCVHRVGNTLEPIGSIPANEVPMLAVFIVATVPCLVI